MAEQTQTQFLQKYGNMMVSLWAMPALLDRFKKEPAAVLKEFGLDPGTAKVQLLKPGQPNDLGITDKTAESQFRLWEQGKKKGKIPLYYVEEPPEGAGGETLSDEELMAVAGGWTISCCSCTPCCCC